MPEDKRNSPVNARMFAVSFKGRAAKPMIFFGYG
jgi:hypothetical protein